MTSISDGQKRTSTVRAYRTQGRCCFPYSSFPRRTKYTFVSKPCRTLHQTSLHAAAGSLALQDRLSVGIISENVASSIVPFGKDSPVWPKMTPLVGPGVVHFIHYVAFADEDMERWALEVGQMGG